MTVWRDNTGRAPQPEHPDDPPIEHVFVRLRNGLQPADRWPSATGRHHTTRWSLTGHPFDIVQWRPA